MIQFSHVVKRYPGGHDAVSNISLQVDAGEMVFLTGHSGAGKSTLLKLVALIERCTRGQVIVDAQNLGQLSRRKIPHLRRKMGIVFQDHNLLFDRTVYENVALPLVISGVRHSEISRRVRAALDKVGLLGKEKFLPVALSTGEQQRVGIARAVVNRPRVLLADEPTGNLDPDLSREIMGIFLEFNRVGTTVLVATHDLDIVKQFGCRNVQLHQGQLSNDQPVTA